MTISCTRGEDQRRDHQHRHRHVAEDQRRDDGRRVAVHQRGGDRDGLPPDQRPDGDETPPRAQRGRRASARRWSRPPARTTTSPGPGRRRRGAPTCWRAGSRRRHVHRAGEERVVQMCDGPGRPFGEPHLLCRITAAARQRGRRVAGPDVPPHDDGGHGESRNGGQVEADAAQRADEGRRGADRCGSQPSDGGVASASGGPSPSSATSASTGAPSDPVCGVCRHIRPARHRRRAYCGTVKRSGTARIAATSAWRGVRKIARVPAPPPLRRRRGGRAGTVRGAGRWRDAAGPSRCSRRPETSGTPAPGPRVGPASSVSAIPSRTMSRWRARPATSGAPSKRESGRRLLHVTGQLTFGDDETLDAIGAALTARGAACERLTSGSARARFPGIATAGAALVEPDSGVLAADACLQALHATAAVELRTGVSGHRAPPGAATASASRPRAATSASADVVVACAGPATLALLGPARAGGAGRGHRHSPRWPTSRTRRSARSHGPGLHRVGRRT